MVLVVLGPFLSVDNHKPFVPFSSHIRYPLTIGAENRAVYKNSIILRPFLPVDVTVHALGAFFRKIDLDMNAVFEDDMHHVVRQSKSAHDSART